MQGYINSQDKFNQWHLWPHFDSRRFRKDVFWPPSQRYHEKIFEVILAITESYPRPIQNIKKLVKVSVLSLLVTPIYSSPSGGDMLHAYFENRIQSMEKTPNPSLSNSPPNSHLQN